MSTNEEHLSILIADDDEIALKPIVAALQAKKHSVTIVGNGRDAVDFVKTHLFDLILMDCDMPVMDGFLATESIRAWEKANDRSPVTIYALTSLNEFGSSLTKEAGMNGHIEKPIRLAVLDELLERVKSNK